MRPAPAFGAAQGEALAPAIGRMAIRALYRELALHPKPGLVSPIDSGAHADMDMSTFLRSLHALRFYFRDIAAAGARGHCFEAMRNLGLAAETWMLAATGGVNTHRGAIFTLGLLAAAAGALLAQGRRLDAALLAETIRARWGDDIMRRGRLNATSNGARALSAHGGRGACMEAAAGFPTLFCHALPALAETLARTRCAERASIQTLFAVMAEIDDTNLLHRAGPAGLAFVRKGAREFLAEGGVDARDWRARAMKLHRECVARRLSPGGAADTLAAALFVQDLVGRNL